MGVGGGVLFEKDNIIEQIADNPNSSFHTVHLFEKRQRPFNTSHTMSQSLCLLQLLIDAVRKCPAFIPHKSNSFSMCIFHLLET